MSRLKKRKKTFQDVENIIGKSMSEYLDKYPASTTTGGNYSTVTLNEYGTGTYTNTMGGLSIPTTTVTTSDVITANDVYHSIAGLRAAYNAKHASDDPDVPTRDEQVAEVASRIENLIADFLPDEHKDLPVKIAHAVAEELVVRGPAIIDVAQYAKAESSIANKIANMSMGEYEKFRREKLGLS